MQICGHLDNHFVLCVEDKLAHNNEELLHQAYERLVLLKKVREGVQYQLRDKLIPQLFELGWQSERTRCVIVSDSVLRIQLAQLLHLSGKFTSRGLCLEQVAFKCFKSLSLLD